MSVYSQLAEILGSNNNFDNEFIKLGTIVSPIPNLQVKCGELNLYKSDLLISKHLLHDDLYIREYQTSKDKFIWSDTNFIKFMNKLEIGDLVVLLAIEDKQRYVILTKVEEVS